MLLVVMLFPFVCALILFAYFFGRFAGEHDTARLADAMRQMNRAKIILFPGVAVRKTKPPIDGNTRSRGEVLLFTAYASKQGVAPIHLSAREVAKETSA